MNKDLEIKQLKEQNEDKRFKPISLLGNSCQTL